MLSLTIQNTGQERLQNYPVAIALDETVFDFTVAKNGSGVAMWDATSQQPMPAWLESYDAVAGKALLWVKVPELDPQASQSLLLTAGPAAGCAETSFDGYSVFPFLATFMTSLPGRRTTGSRSPILSSRGRSTSADAA